MSILQEKLNDILQDKNTNLLSENLKKDVTCLGVEGTLEGGANNQDIDITENGTYIADDGYTGLGIVNVNVPTTTVTGIKSFETEEEMQADATATDGDMAMIYYSNYGNLIEGQTITKLYCPKTVVLDEAITSSVTSPYWYGTESSAMRIRLRITTSQAYISLRIDTTEYSGDFYVYWYSDDGQTYVMEDAPELEFPLDLGDEFYMNSSDTWNDVIGYFMQVPQKYQSKLYEYGNNKDELNRLSCMDTQSIKVDTENSTFTYDYIPTIRSADEISEVATMIKDTYIENTFITSITLNKDNSKLTAYDVAISNIGYEGCVLIYENQVYFTFQRLLSSSATITEFKRITYDFETKEVVVEDIADSVVKFGSAVYSDYITYTVPTSDNYFMNYTCDDSLNTIYYYTEKTGDYNFYKCNLTNVESYYYNHYSLMDITLLES